MQKTRKCPLLRYSVIIWTVCLREGRWIGFVPKLSWSVYDLPFSHSHRESIYVFEFSYKHEATQRSIHSCIWSCMYVEPVRVIIGWRIVEWDEKATGRFAKRRPSWYNPESEYLYTSKYQTYIHVFCSSRSASASQKSYLNQPEKINRRIHSTMRWIRCWPTCVLTVTLQVHASSIHGTCFFSATRVRTPWLQNA